MNVKNLILASIVSTTLSCQSIKKEYTSFDNYPVREGDLTEIKNPGEFVEIKIPNYYLRRPISVHKYGNDYLQLLYKVLGHGTKDMTSYSVGMSLDVLVGLGNGFDVGRSKKPLLIAGGIGIAPMFELATKFNELGIKPTLVYGAAKKEDLAKKSQEDMMKVRNLGKKSLEEVVNKLASLGFAFSKDYDEASSRAIWQFELVDGGYRLKSLHTGDYVNNFGWATHVFLNESPGKITLEVIDEYNAILKIVAGHPMHAAAGGNIGKIVDGDIIEIDIPNRSINVRLSDEELAARPMTPVTRDRVVSKSLRA